MKTRHFSSNLALSSLTILVTSSDINLHQVGCLAPLGGALVFSQRMSPSHLQAQTTTVFTFLEEMRGEKARDRVLGGLRLQVPGTAVTMLKAPSVIPCMIWTSPLLWPNLPRSTLGITKEFILLLVTQKKDLFWFTSIFLFLRAASTGLSVSEMIQHTPVRLKKWNTHLFISEVEVAKPISKQ